MKRLAQRVVLVTVNNVNNGGDHNAPIGRYEINVRERTLGSLVYKLIQQQEISWNGTNQQPLPSGQLFQEELEKLCVTRGLTLSIYN